MTTRIVQSNECCICCEQYTEVNYPGCLPCGHIICANCSRQVNVCPTDRTPFKREDVRRVYNHAQLRTPLVQRHQSDSKLVNKVLVETLMRRVAKLEEMVTDSVPSVASPSKVQLG